ncbi:MAG: DUF4386 domain-containing protein [Candidatus Thorarchaeota archaeon]|jgi:hypothetical protein
MAYLIQFVGSLISRPIIDAAMGSGSIPENLASISTNDLLMRAGIIAEFITVIGIIVMTVLLYIVLEKQNKTFALVALSFWLTEAIFLAISSITAYSLLPLSYEFVQAGSPDPSLMITLGTLLMEMKEFCYAIHMFFFGLGGILWYYMFYKSQYIPKALALWALVLMPLMPIDVLLFLLGIGLESMLRLIILFPLIVYLPYEGVMGLWFIVKGIDDNDST